MQLAVLSQETLHRIKLLILSSRKEVGDAVRQAALSRNNEEGLFIF